MVNAGDEILRHLRGTGQVARLAKTCWDHGVWVFPVVYQTMEAYEK